MNFENSACLLVLFTITSDENLGIEHPVADNLFSALTPSLLARDGTKTVYSKTKTKTDP